MRSLTIRPGDSELGPRTAATGRHCARLYLGAAAGAAFAAGTGAQTVSVRLVNDQASVLHLPAAPARLTPAFGLERRGNETEHWVKVQPLETSFCLNPCPGSGKFPGELDCGRPPRTRISVAAGYELTMAWSGQLVEEVARQDASGKTRTCTQVQPASPGTYRLSLCSEPAASETARCTAVTFPWRSAGHRAPTPQVLRWSAAAVLPAR